MAKFVRVTTSPKSLDKGCIVIDAPNFRQEIENSIKKKPKNGLMASNYLREIFAAINDRYGSENFNTLTSINVSRYRGVPCETNEQIEKIVHAVVERDCSHFIDAFVDSHIKNRPTGTKLIYFLGNFNQTAPFTKNGIDEIKEKEVDVYLGKKSKKIVGKPAITDKQAAALGNNH